MKKFLSLAMMAMFAVSMTMMVSCGKEDNKNGNGGSGGGSQQSIADNTMVYDGVTYKFDNVMVGYNHSSLTLVTAETADTLGDGTPRLFLDGIHITPNAWNYDFNLADLSQWPDEVMVNLVFYGVLDISYTSYVNGDRGVSGRLDGQYYEDESIFTSGTYRVSGNNDGTPVTLTVNGTLRNGKTMQIKLVTPDYQNQVIGR